ncbi:cytochrome P450 [Daedaleopsis nitida]|nr:cytochrome P450 [Daedaleopsis nitida]
MVDVDLSRYIPAVFVFSVAVAIYGYLLSIANWNARTRGRPLPPGPKPLPILGNVLDIPRYKSWIGFRDLCRRYGDIVQLDVLGRRLVILGNAELATEYLAERSSITADKMQSPLVELVGQDLNFGFYPYGERWRQHRRAFWQHFSSSAVQKYRSIQLATSHRFLVRLLNDPSHLKEHIRFTFAATALKLLYDITPADEHDRYITLIHAALEGAAQALATGKYIVIDFFPFLTNLPTWFPGVGFQKKFAEWRASGEELKNVPFAHVKGGIVKGKHTECVVGKALKTLNELGLEGLELQQREDVLKNVGAVAIEGGSDTTFSTIQSFFLAMSLHPEVARKAQAELDAVVGPHRLPDFSDKPSLTYVDTIIKETLRWQNVIPLGVPHRLTIDDEFHGYFMPQGTLLLPNIWACMHDPRVYANPDEFYPDRFIKDGKIDPNVRDPLQFVFGFGRRICPGRHFAEASLFITIASVLHVFDILPPQDEYGHPVKIVPEMSDGLLTYPEDARCTIKPRSAQAQALISAHS